LDAAEYLHIQLGPRLERQRDRHPGTVQVLAMGESTSGWSTLWLPSQSSSHSSSSTYRWLRFHRGHATTCAGRLM
jgi:hypothetical protein